MRIKIDEAIKYYNIQHPDNPINKRRLAEILLPSQDWTTTEQYLFKINKGDFKKIATVNLVLLKELIALTGLSLEDLIDLT